VKRKLIIELSVLIALFGSVWILFIVFPLLPDKKFTVSIEKEEKLGGFIFEKISENPDFIFTNNTYVDSAISIIKNRLETHLKNSDYTYRVFVFKSEIINAFALPGGYIMVSSGLIDFTDNPEEFAAVLAHEIGHIEEKHIIRKMIKELGIGLLTSNDPLVLGEISKMAGSNLFDRKQETQADMFSMDLLLKANIEPRTIAIFFRKIENEKGNYNKNIEFFMSHPHNKTRIKHALSYNIPDNFSPVTLNIDWRRVKAELSK
jgi:predicted Zn-dependent protease